MDNNVDDAKRIRRKEKRIQKCKKIKFFDISQWIIFGLFFIFLILFNRAQSFSVERKVFSIIVLFLSILGVVLSFLKITLTSKNLKIKCLAFFGYIVNGLLFTICYFIGNGDITIFVLFIYNTIFTCFYIIDYSLYKIKFKSGQIYTKSLIVPALFVFVVSICNTIYHSYVNGWYLFLYALIPMVVIIMVFIILSLTLLKDIYKNFFKGIIAKIGIVFMLLLCSYSFGIAFIDSTNCAIKNQILQMDCLITDKNFSHGYRSVDRYELCVVINGNECKVNVTSKVYYAKEINDTLKVNLYKGCFNLEYYECAEVY